MTLRSFQISALPLLAVMTASFLAAGASAQTKPAAPGIAPESAYGGMTVEDIVARVNDQIISRSDYDRATKEMDAEARQRGLSMQQIADGHKDLLRNLIDQQLWLSKGKELSITGETELIKQLDEIRKKYNLETIEDLEKAAREQGVSYEDFKANIRNQIITQQVMRDEVGRRVSVTPGEVQRYYEAHKQDYVQPESVHLGEILIATGGDAGTDDPEKLATAKAKADDIEAKLKAGSNFEQLAKTSDVSTAAEGGDLGKFGPGALAKVLEDATFNLKAGQFTEPIRTRQGYVILKVIEHVPGGVPPFKQVQDQVEETFYMSRMEPAMRTYLTTMREQAFIDIKPGYVDSGASPHETKPIYSAYTPPAPKKKQKVQRTRFRETERGFHKSQPQVVDASVNTTKPTAKDKAAAAPVPTTMKAGKKEKIRYGQAPRETLPNAAETKTEDAGALPKVAANDTPQNPLQAAPAPVKKTRFEARSRLPKEAKAKGPQLDSFAPAPPDSAEVADRQVQSQPLGLGGNTAKKKKAVTATDGKKQRIQDRPKTDTTKQPVVETIPAPVPGAPAPLTAPKADKTDQTTPINSPVPSSAPQQTPTSPDPPQSNLPASEPPH